MRSKFFFDIRKNTIQSCSGVKIPLHNDKTVKKFVNSFTKLSWKVAPSCVYHNHFRYIAMARKNIKVSIVKEKLVTSN